MTTLLDPHAEARSLGRAHGHNPASRDTATALTALAAYLSGLADGLDDRTPDGCELHPDVEADWRRAVGAVMTLADALERTDPYRHVDPEEQARRAEITAITDSMRVTVDDERYRALTAETLRRSTIRRQANAILTRRRSIG